MIPRALFWRSVIKDRIFLLLSGLTLISLVADLLEHRPTLETTHVPFNLGLFFTSVNVFFAILSLRREPLLAYMFLTATILVNGTLYFFFHYLITIQVS